MLWIFTVYASPMDDNGYDVSDYYAVHPMFGTMEDLEKLIDEAGSGDENHDGSGAQSHIG